MAKYCHPDVIDNGLSLIKTGCNQMLACSALPTDRANALTLALADVVMATGDFTLAAGDVSGRKVIVAAKAAVLIDSNGSATHVALLDGTRLLYATTCTLKVLASGDQVNIPTWDAEIQAPA